MMKKIIRFIRYLKDKAKLSVFSGTPEEYEKYKNQIKNSKKREPK